MHHAFLYYFFAVTAQPRFMFCGGCEQGNDFLFLFLNFNTQPSRIQLQKKLPTFDNY